MFHFGSGPPAVSGLSCTSPKGATAPGKIWPRQPVPMSGRTARTQLASTDPAALWLACWAAAASGFTKNLPSESDPAAAREVFRNSRLLRDEGMDCWGTDDCRL